MTTNTTTAKQINSAIIKYLVGRYGLDSDDDNIRYIDQDCGTIECYGRMPNSIETGWFFAGYVSELKRDAERERIVE